MDFNHDMDAEVANQDATSLSDGPGSFSRSDASVYAFEGHVDFYGHHAAAEGWFFGGWIAHPWLLGHRPQNAVAEFTDAMIDDHVHSMFYHREDVSGRGIGYIFFLRPTGSLNGELLSLRLDSAGVAHTIYPTPAVLRLVGSDLVDHLREKLDRYVDWGLPVSKMAVLENLMPPAKPALTAEIPQDGPLRIGFFGLIFLAEGHRRVVRRRRLAGGGILRRHQLRGVRRLSRRAARIPSRLSRPPRRGRPQHPFQRPL